MKGITLNIKICAISALTIGLIMAILNLYESWSQHAGTIHDPMLYVTLFLISLCFIMTSFQHPKKDRVLMTIKQMDIRTEHFLRITSYLFGGVIVFSVNSESNAVSSLHLLFTGLAILSGYIVMITYPKTKKGYAWAIAGFVFGAVGFLSAYLFHAYSIAWGEVLAAFPLCVWILKTID